MSAARITAVASRPPLVGSYVQVCPQRAAEVRKALDDVGWGPSPRHYVPGKGFCVGATMNKRGPLFSPPTGSRQDRLVRAVNRLIASLGEEAFEWSSLQFNCNTVAKPHTDRNNQGLSFILIIGDYEGGSLCVPCRGIRTPEGGSLVRVFMDEREPHHPTAFTGLRYSVVAFVHASARKLLKSQFASLEELEFRAPSHRPPDINVVGCPCSVAHKVNAPRG